MGPRRRRGSWPTQRVRWRGLLRGRSPPKRGEAGSRCRGSGHRSQEPERESAQPSPLRQDSQDRPLRRESERASSRPPSVPRVHEEVLVGKTERNPDADPNSALLIISPHEQLHRAARFAPTHRAPLPSGVVTPGAIHPSVERRTLPTGLREPESPEPESPEPGLPEPESPGPESLEPESPEPGLPEPESSGSSRV